MDKQLYNLSDTGSLVLVDRDVMDRSGDAAKQLLTERADIHNGDDCITFDDERNFGGKHSWLYVKITVSITAHIVLLVCLGALLVTRLGLDGIPVSHHISLAAVIGSIVCYVLILMEAATSDIYSMLLKYAHNLSAESYFERVRDARPQVRWTAVCYHYDYASDKPGRSGTSEVYRVKSRVVTCNEKESFHFTGCKDYTRDIRPLLHKQIIRYECSKVFIFKDEATKKHYLQQFQAFRERARRRDEFMEHEEEFLIPAFRTRALLCVERQGRPWWLGLFGFWLASVLLFTWPYRLILHRRSSHVRVVFIKQLEI